VFDVGFSELMVIGVVALVVIGPERMPGFARTAGALFGRAQRYANQLKADIQNEVDMEEFNRIKATFYDAAKSVEHSVSQAKDEIDAAADSLSGRGVVQSELPVTAGAETQTAAAVASPTVVASDAPAYAAEIPEVTAQQDFWLNTAPATVEAGGAKA
jgi:sec-independent protein translocase protein TatB